MVGDFNVNVHNNSSPLFNQISSLASLLSFKQIVADPTHFSSTGSPSTINLFVPTSLSSSRAIVTSPIGNSNHLSVLSQVQFKANGRLSMSYHQANFHDINKDLSTTDWFSLMSDDLDLSCTNFTDTFLCIINSQVPSKSVRLQSVPPWFPQPLLAKIKQRSSLFWQAKATNSAHLYTQYHSLCNLITAEIKRSKSTFFNSLSVSHQFLVLSSISSS